MGICLKAKNVGGDAKYGDIAILRISKVDGSVTMRPYNRIHRQMSHNALRFGLVADEQILSGERGNVQIAGPFMARADQIDTLYPREAVDA